MTQHQRCHRKGNSTESTGRAVESVQYHCDYPGCCRSFARQWMLNKHRNSHIRPYPCSECGKSFTSSKHLRVHLRSHHNDRNEICTFCDISFIDSSTLRNHMKSAHSDGVSFTPYVCRVCRKSFVKKSLLERHYRTHSSRNMTATIYCTECEEPRGFSCQSNLNRHRREIHGSVSRQRNEATVFCTECDEPRAFISQSNLNRHQREVHGQVIISNR